MTQLNDICSVCGMEPDTEIASVKHNKMYFRFCSDQCRETFVAHPNLYSAKTARQRNPLLKRRVIYLAESIERGVSKLLVSYLEEMMGVKEVAIEGKKIEVSYDLLQVTESQIEKALAEVGIQPGGGWLERLRRAWVREREEVELDNLASPSAPCCNSAPPRS